jgi:2-methylcitrate dehydratase PrpD
MVSFSLRIARHIVEQQQKSLDAPLIHQFKRALFDYLCSAITGAKMPVTNSLIEYLTIVDESRKGAVFGRKERLSILHAAFVNGTSAHQLDFDDGHTGGSIHLGSVVFSAVLAVAEQYSATPEQIMKAVVMGYDVGGKLSAAMHPHVWGKGFHNTPVIGIFGGAAAVASLLNASEEEIANILGLAGSFSSGLFEFLGEGADIKRVHPGKAARDAILCAEMGVRGITGPKKVFEGNNGFIRAYADGKINETRLFHGWGEQYEIMNTYFKPYPCCRHLHSPIDAIKSIIKNQNLEPGRIERIEVGTNHVAAKHGHKNVNHLLDAQMSIPCAVALAIAYGDVTIQTFVQEKIQTPLVQALLDKVHVYIDEDCESAYPKQRPSIVTIRLTNGTEIKEYVPNPKGEVSLPLSDEEVERKFTQNVAGLLGEQKIQSVVDTVWHFDSLDDINSLTQW